MTSSLTPQIQAELAKLRDIHLPDPVGWWPLALGLWVLIALAGLGLVAAIVFILHRRRTVRHAALRELAGLKARFTAETDTSELASDLAILLRRVVLTGPEAHRLGALSGSDWAGELGRNPGGISVPIAEFIANAPYAPSNLIQADTHLRRAIDEAETWIRRHAQ